MAGFGIFFHVLPEVLTELTGLSDPVSIGNVIHVIATVAFRQAHHKILQRCSGHRRDRIRPVGSQ
jgi:hypothetical protein